MEIRGLEGSTPAQERGDGFREGLAENPTADDHRQPERRLAA